MATRKVFTDDSGKELSYRIDASGKLQLEIYMADSTIAVFALEYSDAKEFILELNKIKKQLIAE